MSLPKIVSREEWLTARKALLEKEKAATRARDALNTERRELPMVEIDKDYVFDGPDGKLSLADLFGGRRQLMIYHFMWLDDKDMGCPSCSAFANEVSQGVLDELNRRETTFAFVSRGRFSSIEAFNARMGWPVPWYSSYGSDFNYDFHVTFDESKQPLEYNYRSKEEWATAGWAAIGEWEQPYDLHGLSCFLRDGDQVFHTYSTYGRGTEVVGGPHYFLDLTALGRQEAWEEPKDRSVADAPSAGDERIVYPDEYDA